MKSHTKFRSGAFLIAVFLFLPGLVKGEPLKWHEWSDAVFAEVKKEDKLVLLDLGAVWCHWCHVMDDTTYANPEVIRLLNQKYLVVRVDQDARPDLANRYEDYGWPATIVFKADGSELAKRRGFINPRDMAGMLRAFIADPTPGPSVSAEKMPSFDKTSAEPADRVAAWRKTWLDDYDFKVGGWVGMHKWLDWDNVEYAMESAGDPQSQTIARQMLERQQKLQDPVWGGMDQYSAEGDWEHPHFEKILQMQAENMRIYAVAFERYGDKNYLHVAEEVHRYLRAFLTGPEGVVYTSQDADLVQGEHGGEYFALDDKGRRALGIPRIDRHIYARENGWVICALVEMYAATGDEQYLSEAVKAATWIMVHRSLPGGGFRHDEHDAAGPYLGDTLAMGRAFLRLYGATGNRAWLKHAKEASSFMVTNFKRKDGSPGLLSARTSGAIAPPRPQFDENVSVVRFANLLFRYAGAKSDHELAEVAFRYVASPVIAEGRGAFVGGLLLAVRELETEPLHLVIVGKKADPAARKLFMESLGSAETYKQTEWYDRAEGPLPGSDLEYPELPVAAAFICADGACSAPVTTSAALLKKISLAGNKPR